MAVREFDGIDDDIVCAPGALAGIRYGTVAIIAKRATSGEWHAHFFLHGDDGEFNGGTQWSTSDEWNWFAAGHSEGPSVSTGVWYLCVVRKATGSSVPRYSVYNFDTQSWTHADGASARGDWASGALDTDGSIRFSFEGTGDFMDGRVAIRAVWLDSLPWSDDTTGDAAIEAAGLESAAFNWADANPDAGWKFDQESTSTAVEDWTGGGADQTSITGTTVITGDDPPGFDFALTPSTTIDDTPTGMRLSGPTETLSGAQPSDITIDDTPTGMRLGGPTETLSGAQPPGQVTLDDTPTGMRLGGPTETLSGAQSPSQVTLDDTPTGMRLSGPDLDVIIDSTLIDVPTGMRLDGTAESVNISSLGTVTVADTPNGIRLSGPADTLVTDWVVADAPAGMRLGGPAETVVAAEPITEAAIITGNITGVGKPTGPVPREIATVARTLTGPDVRRVLTGPGV